MKDKITHRSCEEFARVLAAKEAVPGGGGAAALVGSLAVALCSMVGNYTSGKKAYASVEEDVERMLDEAERVRLRLLELVDEDAEAFYPLSQAYAIPRDDPRRSEVLEDATKAACAAPVEMMRHLCKAIGLLEEMGEKGSRMLDEAERLRLRLLELVDEDAEAFYPLSQAYAIPRDDPHRSEVLEDATKQACAAPVEMMRYLCKAIELLEEMGEKGSRMLLSDVACGALLAKAALEAASVNVYVNTKTLRDEAFVRATEREVDGMLATYPKKAEACAQRIVDAIRGRG